MKCFLIWGICAAALIYIPGRVWAQLLINERKPFSITSLTIQATIGDQVATVQIEQTFHNESSEDIEALFLFPLPEAASITNFSCLVDGQSIAGEIVDKREASALYESLVRGGDDPRLLEYVDKGLFRMRLSPVPAQSETQVIFNYEEIVKYDAGLYRWRYPLSTGKFSARPIGLFHMNIEIEAAAPIGFLYSPTHEIKTLRRDEGAAVHVEYTEEELVPQEDFVLVYDLSSQELGMNILTHKGEGEDGFYVLMINPSLNSTYEKIIPKDIVFVLDTSLSMKGAKMEQAKAALMYCLSKLREGDRFNIVRFDSEVMVYTYESGIYKNLLRATEDTIGQAREYIARLEASGSTNINEALLSGLSLFDDTMSTPMMLFLTDGQPKVGIRDRDEISQQVRAHNLMEVRFFIFGVGHDVNTILLDQLAHKNKGTSSYVQPDQDIGQSVALLYDKIAHPVLTDLSLAYEGIDVYDSYPFELPDLYKGTQLIIMGRYTADEDTEALITLIGRVNTEERSFTFPLFFPREEPENDFCTRLWAARKIGSLLNRLRLGIDKEVDTHLLKEEIVALSKHYVILTPLTYYLITGDSPAGRSQNGYSDKELTSLTNWWMYTSKATPEGGYTVTMAAGPEEEESGPQFSITATYDKFRQQLQYQVVYEYVTGTGPLNPSSYNWTLPFFTMQVQPYAIGNNLQDQEEASTAPYDSLLWSAPYFGQFIQQYIYGSLLPQVAHPHVSLGVSPPQASHKGAPYELLSMSAETGPDAVAASLVVSDLYVASTVSNLDKYSIETVDYIDKSGAARIKIVEDKVFILKATLWIDSEYQGGPVTIQLRHGSKRYRAYKEEVSYRILYYLSVGNNLIVCLPDGKTLRVTNDPFVYEFGYNEPASPSLFLNNNPFYITIMREFPWYQSIMTR
ncbi:MAG: VIT and vWA domain-containing protein [bacterium]